jgi:hypothetical protein
LPRGLLAMECWVLAERQLSCYTPAEWCRCRRMNRLWVTGF